MPASHLTVDRPAAHVVPGATWQAHVVDVGAITKELNRLWARFGGDGRGGPDARELDGPAPVGVLTRASTLNLMAVARSRADARRVEDAVTHLGDLYPSRATILVADPDRPPEGDGGLDVRVALLEQEAGKGRGAIRFESVTVEGSAANERKLASIAAPLLVVDLPDFLWWASDTVIGSPLFDDLVEIADRLIVDTAAAPAPADELRFLADLLARTEACPKLSDFAWARLAPWRGLIAQFFDTPTTRPALDALDEVSIAYGANPRDPRSGFTGALLLAGWLASRLGWQPPGELVANRGETGGWHATLRAGSRTEPREVVVTLHPNPRRDLGRGLAEVTLLANGGTTGRFRVERIDADELMTSSQLEELPRVSRMAFAPLAGDAELLADELRRFDRDATFEAALGLAALLAPGGQRFGGGG